MAWLRIDTGFARHRKIGRLPLAQRWQHLEAMCWCAEMGTDGQIATGDLSVIWPGMSRAASSKLAGQLVQSGLWDETEGGWEIHDWSVYNISSEEAKQRRDREAQRKKEWRARRQKSGNVPPDKTRDSTQDKTRQKTRTSSSRVKTRPDPTRPPLSGGGEGGGHEPTTSPASAAASPEPSPGAQAPPPGVEVNGSKRGPRLVHPGEGPTSFAVAAAEGKSSTLAALAAIRRGGEA